MLKLIYYYYYSKNDNKKEPIDKVLSASIESSIEYFSMRKNMNQADFLSLYTVEGYYEETKSE
jgi:hypothetical protein